MDAILATPVMSIPCSNLYAAPVERETCWHCMRLIEVKHMDTYEECVNCWKVFCNDCWKANSEDPNWPHSTDELVWSDQEDPNYSGDTTDSDYSSEDW